MVRTTLLVLPNEVLLLVGSFLRECDLSRLLRSCTLLRDLLTTTLFRRDRSQLAVADCIHRADIAYLPHLFQRCRSEALISGLVTTLLEWQFLSARMDDANRLEEERVPDACINAFAMIVRRLGTVDYLLWGAGVALIYDVRPTNVLCGWWMEEEWEEKFEEWEEEWGSVVEKVLPWEFYSAED